MSDMTERSGTRAFGRIKASMISLINKMLNRKQLTIDLCKELSCSQCYLSKIDDCIGMEKCRDYCDIEMIVNKYIPGKLVEKKKTVKHT